METIPTNILTKEKFLIVDNAPSLSADIEIILKQIFTINDLDFSDFKYHYVQATSDNALPLITEFKNILVFTTFTTIKSNAFEDLIEAGIKINLQNKNILSLMQFGLVGEDFEYYKPELAELFKNNINFYFLSENYTSFNLYKPKH